MSAWKPSILCPRCRALGLETDCSEQLGHAHKDTAMNETDSYELEVTLTFPVPVTSTLPLDPHEMATHVRERWINEDLELAQVVARAIDEESFDLQVRPAFID